MIAPVRTDYALLQNPTFEKPTLFETDGDRCCDAVVSTSTLQHAIEPARGNGNFLLLRTTPMTRASTCSKTSVALWATSQRDFSASTTRTTPSHKLAKRSAEFDSWTAGRSTTTKRFCALKESMSFVKTLGFIALQTVAIATAGREDA